LLTAKCVFAIAISVTVGDLVYAIVPFSALESYQIYRTDIRVGVCAPDIMVTC